MSWFLNVCVISALMILIMHSFYDYWKEGHAFVPTADLVDLRTQKYKNIIETLIKEKEEESNKKVSEQNMDDELMEYMQSKFVVIPS